MRCPIDMVHSEANQFHHHAAFALHGCFDCGHPACMRFFRVDGTRVVGCGSLRVAELLVRVFKFSFA